MDEPPSRYDVTVRVAHDDGRQLDPAAFAVAASQAASSGSASVVSAHKADEIICVVSVQAPDRPSAVSVALAVVADAVKAGGSGPVTQPESGRWPRSCGGSKNTACRSWSWQRLQVTRTCPMPRPPRAASRADSQMHGVQLTGAWPGHSW